MNLRKVLSSSVISCDLPGKTKEEVIGALMDMAMKTGKVRNRETAMRSILEREQQMSTGIQNGVAIPHGKTDAVDELVACLGVKKEGIDFEALDGEESRIFFMTLSPAGRSGPHVQFLAEVSQLLINVEKRDLLLKAATAEEILEIITT